MSLSPDSLDRPPDPQHPLDATDDRDAAGDRDAAEADAQRAEGSLQSHLMAATALLHVNELDAAIRAFESVIAMAPDRPLPRYRLAVANALDGRHERALAALADAVGAGFRQPETARGRARLRALPRQLRLSHEPRAGAPQPAPVRGRRRPPGVRLLHRALAGRDTRRHGRGHQPHRGGPRRRGPDRALDVESTGTRATSLNRLDPVTGTWRQTWVDDQGDVVEFVDGHIDDGAMRFVAHGEGVERRLAFFPQGPDALRQLSEASERRRRDVVDRVRPALPAPGRDQTGRHRAGRRARGRRLTGRAVAGRGSGGRATRPRRGPGEEPDARADLRRARRP